jgi:hypothetical protein
MIRDVSPERADLYRSALVALTTPEWVKIGHRTFRMAESGELEVRATFGRYSFAHGVGLRDAIALAANAAHLTGRFENRHRDRGRITIEAGPSR